MSTSLTSELHPCSGLRCSVSRIKKSSVAESRVYAMWLREKKKTKETSNSGPKCCQGEKGGDPQQLYPECCYRSRESHSTRHSPTPGVQI